VCILLYVLCHARFYYANITHAPLNMHRAMLNLVRTPARQNFPCITTLYCETQKLSAHTRALIFFAQCHFALRNTKFYHVHLHSHTNIFPCNATLHHIMPSFSACIHTPLFFHAMPLCTGQRQILLCAPGCQYFSTQCHFAPHNAKF
jgi:hypothetical protein